MTKLSDDRDDVHVLLRTPGHSFTNVSITNATDVRSLYYAYKRVVMTAHGSKRQQPHCLQLAASTLHHPATAHVTAIDSPATSSHGGDQSVLSGQPVRARFSPAAEIAGTIIAAMRKGISE